MNLEGFIDGNNLVTPNRVTPGTIRGSDNGPLYSSIACILNSGVIPIFETAIEKCIDKDGKLHRAPGDTSPDAPDDYYGVLSMCSFNLLECGIKLEPRLWQPVLVYLWLLQKMSCLAPLLSPLVAVIVAFSNFNTDKNDTSNRILTWTICQALKKRSALPALAARFWEWRQIRIYGSFSQLFQIYYGPDHPFVLALRK